MGYIPIPKKLFLLNNVYSNFPFRIFHFKCSVQSNECPWEILGKIASEMADHDSRLWPMDSNGQETPCWIEHYSGQKTKLGFGGGENAKKIHTESHLFNIVNKFVSFNFYFSSINIWNIENNLCCSLKMVSVCDKNKSMCCN